jgi:hypothetical protein
MSIFEVIAYYITTKFGKAQVAEDDERRCLEAWS